MSRLIDQIENIDNVERIKSIQFSIFNPEDIRNGSVCEIITPETYDGLDPKIGGLFDPRMGVIEDGRICATCENKSDLCVGHFGHIELALPVFNIQYIDMIIKILRCVCFRCSNLLINKSDPSILEDISKKTGKARFNAVYNYAQKIKKCQYNDGCRVLQPKKYYRNNLDKMVNYEKHMIYLIAAEFSPEAIKDPKIQSQKQIFTPQICHNILRKITFEDCEFLGFSNKHSRPEWMLMTAFPIPPPSVRPSVRQDNNQRSEDDLTYFLTNIIKTNRLLRQKIESGAKKTDVDDRHSCLQYYVATYMDNEIPSIPSCAHRSQRVLKALTQRLKGKEGRVRGNIMGKRVDFSARSVISVGTDISIDEFGVPYEIAMNLTYPEVVTRYNMADVYKLVRNGPTKYPGAKSIRKTKYDCNGNPAPCTILLKYVDVDKVILHEGDIVNRHLMDGDICLFNRQPSLHRMSMMGLKARILPAKTFRLNVFVTRAYNADFDGDEMNAHAVQSEITSQELLQLTSVPTQIISPSKCAPIISVVQDSLDGAYLLTQDHIKVYRTEINNLLMRVKDFTGYLPPADGKDDFGVEYWTGRTLYSLILPDLSFETTKKSGEVVRIKNGLYLQGSLDKGVIDKLVQDIVNNYGKDKCHKFLDDTQYVITRWFENYSFSVGLSDMMLPQPEMRAEIDSMIDAKLVEINKLLVMAQQGVYEPHLDNYFRKLSLELEILKKQSEVTENVIKYITSKLSKFNRLLIMATSGSKGDDKNLMQISGLLGQQSIWGSRIADGFTDRTLPHFQRYDFGPSSKGFVRNSYITGLEPQEFFFSMMAGRVGSIDTAVRTAESGYISRRMIKAEEDVKIMYDNTVRNASNNIIQFLYSDNSFDPIRLEKYTFNFIAINNVEMDKRFRFATGDSWEAILRKSAIDELFAVANYGERLDAEFSRLMGYREVARNQYFRNIGFPDIVTYLPFNPNRLISSVQYKFNVKEFNVSDLNPIYIIDKIDELCRYITKYLKDDDYLELVKIVIRSTLSAKMCIVKHKFNKLAFDYIVNIIANRTIEAFVQPGEGVGVISAQSLGEISTQLTLNTFHKAGQSSGSVVVTEGVPRFKEIINLSKNIKTPSMSIYLKPEYANNRDKCEKILNQITYTKLSDLVLRTKILYEDSDSKSNSDSAEDSDKDNFGSLSDEDYEFMKLYDEFNSIICVDDKQLLSKWVLRVEFDRETLMTKNILMSDIQEAILQNCNSEDDIQCIINDDNSGNLVMRIKVRSESDDGSFLVFLKDLEKHIMMITLRGIKDIRKVDMKEYNIVRYDGEGNPVQKKEWMINTEGSNLLNVMAIDYLDLTRTDTNDIIETLEIFGIEACRAKLIQEIYKIFASNDIYNGHVALLADVMTYRGVIMQIDRHGINRSPDNGIISKASFEEVSDILLKASTFAETDKMTGVSANIMFGQLAPGGTASFDIIFDEDKYSGEAGNMMESISEMGGVLLDEKEVGEKIGEMYQEYEPELEVKDSDFDFDYNLENLQHYNLGMVKQVNIEDAVKVVDDESGTASATGKKKQIRIKKK